MSLATATADLSRPVPTPTEITDYLMYMDDLNAIRWFGTTAKRFSGILLIAHLLFGIGMVGQFIQPDFGLISWVSMALVFVFVAGQDFKMACPRCSEPFRCKIVLGFRTPAAMSDSCAHCGLRALSQADIRRAGVDSFHPESDSRVPNSSTGM